MNKNINSSVAYLIIIFISLICGICIMSSIQKRVDEETALMLRPTDMDNLNINQVKLDN